MRTLLPGDNPQAYIPEDRRRALARGLDLPRVTAGAAVFVDIAGYTPLAEALARVHGGRRGAEEITATLDRVFAALIEALHRWRASVVYFSGDAVTAWIDGDDGARATACALELQRVMAEVGAVPTPDGDPVRLGLKVAVAVGRVHRFVVGDQRVQLVDVLAGQLMDSLAAAEQQSRAGDVVLDAGALASLGERVALRETRQGQHGPVGVLEALTSGTPELDAAEAWPRLPDETAQEWLLPAVWERMVAGRGEFLADLRPAVPIFVRFGGLDFENDPEAPRILDDFVTRAQLVLAEHGGSVLQLTIGDKGAYLYGVFGAPVAHEDDAARACEAALRLLDVAADVPVADVRIGVATGRLRSGTYGHAERRTFCCLGDPVNLAARLMSQAAPGEIRVHGDVAVQAGGRFTWAELTDTRVKGREETVSVRALLARVTASGHLASVVASRALVGRRRELRVLRDLWDAVRDGAGQVVVVQAEAGTGKSRLVQELTDRLDAGGIPVVAGEAALARQATYAVWRGVWSDLLGLGPDSVPSDVTAAVEALDPQLAARAPLLGPVLGLALPDSDLTAAFDGELRKTSLEDLLARLLAARAARSPLVIVLEDAQWLDPLSRDLLEVLGRTVAVSPVLLVVLSRPDGSALAGLPVRPDAHVTDLLLEALEPADARALVEEQHRSLVGHDPAPELVAMVVGRAEGNPFYLEQLVEYVLSQAAEGATDMLELPVSLHSLVLSRIDAHAEGSRRAVKVASVVGRDFRTHVVAAAYPDLGVEESVHQDLLDAATTRLIELEDAELRAWAFGHAVTRDVAYDSLPFRTRSVLHSRVGDALESEPDGPRRHLDLLAYHYSRGDDLPKKRHYLWEAAAAARATYAQETAIAYLEELLPIVEPLQRDDVLLMLAEALSIGGDWAAAEDAVASARASAEETGDTAGVANARVARAELDRKQGRYAEAEAELVAAEAAFTDVGDVVGRGQVLHLRGTLESQQGHPAEARAAYEESLTLRRELGDEAGVAAMLTNLALVAEDEGDLEEAERLGREGLARRRALDDRRAVSVSLTNMGMLATVRGDLPLARERFLEAQSLAEEVGDPWVVAVGRHNLANVSRDLGDLGPAASDFRVALDAYVERDDRWSLAHVFEDIACWALASGGDGDADAVFLVAAAERLREEIGAPRFPPTEAALTEALVPARARTPRPLLDAAQAEGSAADLADAARRARAVIDR
jgi:adenylate cyclase